MSYKEALAWLYATQRFGIKLGLTNAERLFRALRLPSAPHRVMHVAGTNGKGSVCAMSAAVSRAAGHRTGLFTSPHLISFRERIQVDDEMIGELAVANGLTAIRECSAAWDPHPTFFEITTALALRYFADRNCDVVILETGLGGRLDATNAIASDVAVLTPISLDHQEWLGRTLGEIASEKAGIIKRRIPVISAPQDPIAEAVIQARAAECEAPLTFVEQPYGASAIGLIGDHQRHNAALAVSALAAAKISVSESAIKAGLADVTWPARFQLWDERLVIDGAHNDSSAASLAETWRDVFGDERADIIFGTLRDKDAAAIWRSLEPIARRVLLPHFAGDRAASPADLRAIISRIAPTLYVVECESIGRALAEARTSGARILLTGSLHFAGEALAFLRGEPSAFEECAQ